MDRFDGSLKSKDYLGLRKIEARRREYSVNFCQSKIIVGLPTIHLDEGSVEPCQQSEH